MWQDFKARECGKVWVKKVWQDCMARGWQNVEAMNPRRGSDRKGERKRERTKIRISSKRNIS